MDTKYILAISDDGSIEYRALTEKYLEETIDITNQQLFKRGTVNTALGTPNDPEAISELSEIPKATAKDGVSVIAIDKETRRVVGVMLNKILEEDDDFFEKLESAFRNPRSRFLMDLIIRSKTAINLYDLCKVDCRMELLFLGTVPEYEKRGIATKLVQLSIDLAKELQNGNNVKTSVDGRILNLEPRPEIVTAFFTSKLSQKIGRKLNFTIASELHYEEFQFQGRKISELVIAPGTIEYLKLKKYE